MLRKSVPLAICTILLATTIVCGADPVQALVGRDGRIQIGRGSQIICQLEPGLFTPKWESAEASADPQRAVDPPRRAFRLAVPGGGSVAGLATIVAQGDALKAGYTFTPAEDAALNSLHVAAEFPIAALAGARWSADGRSGTFPAAFGDQTLFDGPVRVLQINTASDDALEFRFAEPTNVLLQDNRQWGPSYALRIYRSSSREKPFRKGAAVKIDFLLSARGGFQVEHDAPVTIVAGKDWVPLQLQLDVEAGSALDFSQLQLHDAPAGKHGWLQSRSDGTFAFEAQPDRPVRFYGVNLCFSAHYITHEQADRLAERLMRLGYNTVRFHHYEGELVTREDSTQLDPEKLDQLDYLFAALTRRGIYVTTDLFVSRPVRVASILPDYEAGRRDEMNAFKVLAANNEKAYENWKAFSRNLLTHVNPYTQRAYKDDPGLAWLSLINEGNLTNFVDLLKDVPDYQRGWNAWLVEQYKDRSGLAAAWGSLLRADEDPARGSVQLGGNVYNQDVRVRDVIRFLTHVDREFLLRATKFLREEVGTRALVTNMNAWTNHVVTQSVRVEMDYVDDHFYVDHPEFIEQPWRLPSRCPNTSAVAGGAAGGRHITLTRLFDRPFTLSEYNYSGPGQYRGVGGILTGSLGALQGWGAIWRFTYSHSRDNTFQPAPLGYFDMATDPLGQAAERASICLFLRGDLQAAPHSVALVMTPQDLTATPARIPNLAASWHWAAWLTRIGTRVVSDPAAALPHDLVLPLGWATPENAYSQSPVAGLGDPYKIENDKLMSALKQRGIVDPDNPTDPARNVFQSETGEITIDAPRDLLTLDTPRTAGGYGAAGSTIQTRHGVEVRVRDVPATVWASTLDGKPIAESRRLLVTHLTDLQNTDIHYAERARRTLLGWGKLPHLVRAGQAEVRLQTADPQTLHVWALSTAGKRLLEIPARTVDGALVFTLDVAGGGDHGAILCYEVAVQ